MLTGHDEEAGDRTAALPPPVASEPACANTSSLKMSFSDVKQKLIPAMGHEPVYIDLKTEE